MSDDIKIKFDIKHFYDSLKREVNVTLMFLAMGILLIILSSDLTTILIFGGLFAFWALYTFGRYHDIVRRARGGDFLIKTPFYVSFGGGPWVDSCLPGIEIWNKLVEKYGLFNPNSPKDVEELVEEHGHEFSLAYNAFCEATDSYGRDKILMLYGKYLIQR